MTTAIIEKPLTRFRLAPTRGGNPKVIENGGNFNAGLIRDVSVITYGEALGHRQWIDKFALEQVFRMGSAFTKGLKSRFTHPSLSGDGMGTMLGRFSNFRQQDGDVPRVIADLHFSKSSHETPDGDLAAYVMKMANEDADAFGTSIVFDHHYGDEETFAGQHRNDEGNFVSPDAGNTKNFTHIRLARLWANDIVDTPAANPGGLFYRDQEIASEADQLCMFALGLTSERPALQHLSADADRIAQYAARFLESNHLELRRVEMSVTQEQLTAQLGTFKTDLMRELQAMLAAAPIIKPEAEPSPSVAELEKRGAERLSQLCSLAANAGLPEHEKVGKEWFDQGLSFADATNAIKPLMVAGNKFTKDSGEQVPDGDSKYRKEYESQAETFGAMGITFENYAASRRIDDGKKHQQAKPAA